MHICVLDNMSRAGFPELMATISRDSTSGSVTRRTLRLLVGIAVVLVVFIVIALFFWGGLFTFQPEEGETFWHLVHQKGHWYLEVLISGVETICSTSSSASSDGASF